MSLPRAIFVVDMSEDALAIKEAREKGIATFGFADTNADPSLVDCPIPANDDSISSVKLILGEVSKAILRGKAKMSSVKIKPAA